MGTAFHGGKQKQGKKIAQAIYNVIYEHGFDPKGYAEPFTGMCGVYHHIPSLLGNDIEYKAGDISESVIAMWNKAQKGWSPPSHCSEEEYNKLKAEGKTSALRGFIGHACAFGGQYFGTFNKSRENTAHLASQSKNVKEIAAELKNTTFTHGSYEQFSDLEGYVIYCDPPYTNTENRYYDEKRNRRGFDYAKFLKWCDMMSQKNYVFMTEYTPPPNFEVVWASRSGPNKHRGRSSKGSECLFLHL